MLDAARQVAQQANEAEMEVMKLKRHIQQIQDGARRSKKQARLLPSRHLFGDSCAGFADGGCRQGCPRSKDDHDFQPSIRESESPTMPLQDTILMVSICNTLLHDQLLCRTRRDTPLPSVQVGAVGSLAKLHVFHRMPQSGLAAKLVIANKEA